MTSSAPAFDFTSANWPDRTEECLLRACLCAGPEAIAAWHDWQQLVPFDDIDLASQRLVPLLLYNLTRLGVQDEVFGRYRGLRRRNWYLNQLNFRRGTGLLQQFANAKIPTMVLKGAALAHLYYPDTSLRPMSDFDVLVPPANAGAALAMVQSAGLTPIPGRNFPLRIHRFSSMHGWDFTAADGSQIDLHWRVMKSSLGPDTDRVFWAGAEPLIIAGVPTLALNATDQLLHACAHGLAVNVVAPMRWVVDAMMILRQREIDWDRLLAQVRAQYLSVIMPHALGYLRERFAAPVPASVFQRLAEMPAAAWEEGEFAASTRPGSWALHWSNLFWRFRRLRQMDPGLAAIPLPRAYLLYLQHHWDLDDTVSIPRHILKWTQLRAKKRLWPAGFAGTKARDAADQATPFSS